MRGLLLLVGLQPPTGQEGRVHDDDDDGAEAAAAATAVADI